MKRIEFATGAGGTGLRGMQPEEYKGHYNRGWTAGRRGNGLTGADDRREPDAWYDGYLDNASGRDKWHLPNCPDHDNCGRG